MKIERVRWHPITGWQDSRSFCSGFLPQLVLVFGRGQCLSDPRCLTALQDRFPGAQIAMASSESVINGDCPEEETVVCALAIMLEKSRLEVRQVFVSDSAECSNAGQALAKQLVADDLSCLFVLLGSKTINPEGFLQGINAVVNGTAAISGGVASNGNHFDGALVGLNGVNSEYSAVAIAFYGERLRAATACGAGWRGFGPSRIVTAADENVLHELDGRPAMALYREYLGEWLENTPVGTFRYPLAIHCSSPERRAVRAVVPLEDSTSSSLMIYGTIPTGTEVQMLYASHDDLMDGITQAADLVTAEFSPELVLCVSCTGRTVVMGEFAEDEVEAVRSRLGTKPELFGFYSYGEIAPADRDGPAVLHNQTMVLTGLREL